MHTNIELDKLHQDICPLEKIHFETYELLYKYKFVASAK